MARKQDYSKYNDFLKKVGYGRFDDVDMTHDGYPLSVKEAKFIDILLATGNLNHALRESGARQCDVIGKDYISDEISYRLDALKKETIADADEIMTYFTRVMRGEEKDQFGLDAPLAERTAAAKELAKRIVDTVDATSAPEIRVTLNWEGM